MQNIDELMSEITKLRTALSKIAKWYGEFPSTGLTYADGTPISWGVVYGSNGERDYMREVARYALEQPKIDTGDVVYHIHTKEYWRVAYVDGNCLAWLGWPEGEANLVDCKLVSKCSDEFRQNTLVSMALGEGRRGDYARNRLSTKA